MFKIDRREFLIAGSTATGVLSCGLSAAKASSPRVIDLKTDYIECPMGVENPRPQLSWRLSSDRRNVKQIAYRILVARNETALARREPDLWDSGKINSSRSFGIKYEGAALTSRQRCWWCVQVWDESGRPSEFSDASWWEMGLLEPSDWLAQWLAVENATGKADREAVLRWIWCSQALDTSAGQRSVKFRCRFSLSQASQGGELFAIANDWIPWSQIARVWLDEDPIVGSGTWNETRGVATHSSYQISLAAMSPGEHLIAVEVLTNDAMRETNLIRGLALSARFDMQGGKCMRIGTGSNWRASLIDDRDWYTLAYDDGAWDSAIEALIEGYQPLPARPAMHLRRAFAVEKTVREARLYVTALGAYEARLNGSRIGDALLRPEISQYAQRVLYCTCDVTTMIEPGENVLGLTVGDGWYASFDGNFAWAPPPRRALAQLELTFVDGSRQVIATGRGWQTAESPIRASQIKSGEFYDARLEWSGWDRAHFDDSKWIDAELAASPSCRLMSQVSPPIRVTQILKPQAISEITPGVYTVDFGQNFSGWCRLRVKGSEGARIDLEFAELLAPSGEIDQPFMNIGIPKKDTYVLRGNPEGETFEPKFTYRGFRYVKVTGLETQLSPESIDGLFVHSDLRITGRLSTDVPLIEEIWRTILRTQRSNFVGIATDNPSREQRGWLGDAGILWDTAAFNMDVCAFTSRLMNNVVDDQTPDGAFQTMAPEPRHNNSHFNFGGGSPAWGDAGIILPWTVWWRYGDLAIIERNWDAMSRYAQFILKNNPDHLWKNQRGRDYGDHLALADIDFSENIPSANKDLVATAYWAHSVALLAKMGDAIGRVEDADHYRLLFDRIRQAFNSAFVKDDGTVGNGSQACYILALRFKLLPEGVKQIAAERLAAEVRKRGVSLTTGILGTQFSLDVLADADFSDLAYGLLLRTEYPSWGYMINSGATTVWESWSGRQQWKSPNGIKVSEMARNQYALGAIGGFMFRRIAGIDAAAPGFETVAIRPLPDARIKRGGGDYDSVMGRISTDWQQHADGAFSLKVTIPPNVSARVHLPAPSSARIREGRCDVTHCQDLRLIDRSDREIVLEVGAGSYSFTVSA